MIFIAFKRIPKALHIAFFLSLAVYFLINYLIKSNVTPNENILYNFINLICESFITGYFFYWIVVQLK